MALTALVLSSLGLIPVIYLVYSRAIRKRHKFDVAVGNVSLTRVVSADPARNEKLAFVMYGVTLVNAGPDPTTLKDVVFRYKFDGRREAPLATVPTGQVHGKESVAMANASDRIILAWHNLREVILQRRALAVGETLSGSAIFFLDVPVDKYHEVAKCKLVMTDYSGRQSRHKLSAGPAWYNAIEKGMSLVDAPVREKAGIIEWDGVVLGGRSA
jgi:hypothetical protein